MGVIVFGHVCVPEKMTNRQTCLRPTLSLINHWHAGGIRISTDWYEGVCSTLLKLLGGGASNFQNKAMGGGGGGIWISTHQRY